MGLVAFRVSTLFDRFRRSVRAKLLVLVLLPLVVVLPLLIAILALWGGDAYDRLLIYKIRSDLAVAEGHFERVKEGVGRKVEKLADSSRLSRVIATANAARMTEFLRTARVATGVDFLHFADREGRVRASSGRLAAGTALVHWPVVRAAMAGRPEAALDIFAAGQLGAIDPAMRERAAVPLIATRNAAPSDRQREDRGMVLHAAAPIHDDQGRIVGVLVGGSMLNRNLGFVDHINEIIYAPGSLLFGSHGTATLFLDDVRIATNVRLFRDASLKERAIGTRVSASVRRTVLDEGNTWYDRAFVVNDWYVSAYRPLFDSHRQRVGMLYVGYLEAPFRDVKQWALAGIVAVFLVAILAATLLSLGWARGIFRPLEKMNQTMSAIEAGAGDARVGDVASRDEIGLLATHFDQLLDRLREKSEALRAWGAELDHKVAQRTRDLEESNRALREAQRQLVTSEKLAAIGQLTAGVAHEINNPVAVIQGNLDLVREVLGGATQPVMQELRLLDQQVERIRLIVTKLLQFARPSEFAGYVETVSPRAVIADSLVLVGHLLRRGHIAVTQDIATERGISINRTELQQVLINLLVNAIQAMPEGGTLTLRARDWVEQESAPGVVLSVQDTGAGIEREHLDRVFDPFFSTKGQGGTGLGLSVSYGLVERYGGRITVDSRPGCGATFHVWLRESVELSSLA